MHIQNIQMHQTAQWLKHLTGHQVTSCTYHLIYRVHLAKWLERLTNNNKIAGSIPRHAGGNLEQHLK